MQDAIEPAAGATKAWVLPASTAGEVHGAGHIPGLSGEKIAFGFHAKSSDKGLKGGCHVVDRAANPDRTIKCVDVTALVVSGNMATLYGNALDNGAPTTYVIEVSDNGNPGKGKDTFSITTTSGYTASGVLEGGNIHVKD